MAWTTAGELMTSTKMNTIFPAGASDFQTWSPSYANLTVGNGTVVARYTIIGDLVVARWVFTLGST